jgi:hypothetical protein
LVAQHARVIDQLSQDVDHYGRGDERAHGVAVGQAVLE